MAGVSLYPYQLDAVNNLHNGSILCGGVGSGKSRTALAYYYIQNGGVLNTKNYRKMKNPKDLYIITTARKRDTLEWEHELTVFLMSKNPEVNLYKNKIVVDSWNNIQKYIDVTDAFFIFDEQRVVGYGAWVQAFLKIAKKNKWILLSATPGDTWMDYVPVFIANGFYKNKTDFVSQHVVYNYRLKFPKVDRYLNTGKLNRLRRDILVNMDFKRETKAHHEDIYCNYNMFDYMDVKHNRKNLETGKPIKNASEFCQALRRIVNTSESRQLELLELYEKHPKMIIFYNYDYELELLRSLQFGTDVEVAEWNGYKHEPVPKSEHWVYLVQYTAGAEGWNCTDTDTIVFYSQNYSYKIMAQAAGRIDRLNTPFTDLYYYHLKSRASIDIAIGRALKAKKKFNESSFVERKV